VETNSDHRLTITLSHYI